MHVKRSPRNCIYDIFLSRKSFAECFNEKKNGQHLHHHASYDYRRDNKVLVYVSLTLPGAKDAWRPENSVLFVVNCITETSPCAIGNFRKWLLYKCFMSLSLIVIQTNI